VFASHNKDKPKEIAAPLAPFKIEAVSAEDPRVAELDETETTFIGNAQSIQHELWRHMGMFDQPDNHAPFRCWIFHPSLSPPRLWLF